MSGDHTCPECGLQFSVSEPAESFDGFEKYDRRACEYDGRVYIHSDGDVRGYSVEQMAESAVDVATNDDFDHASIGETIDRLHAEMD